MKVYTISLLVLLAVVRASALSWLHFLPIIFTVNEPVEGFFGIFRRRESPPVLKEVPEGPVRFPVQNQEPFRGNMFFPQNFMQSGFRPNPFNNWFSPPRGMQNLQNMAGMQNLPNMQNMAGMQSLSNMQNMPGMQNLPSMQDMASMQNLPSMQDMAGMENLPQTQNFEEDEQSFDRNVRFDDQPPAINTEEAESFFTLLAETDENKCISRLVCEMGADPKSAGDLGQTVNEIIGSLTDFPPGSKVSEYNEILRSGRFEGGSFCVSQYSSCDEETYLLMKSNQPDD